MSFTISKSMCVRCFASVYRHHYHPRRFMHISESPQLLLSSESNILQCCEGCNLVLNACNKCKNTTTCKQEEAHCVGGATHSSHIYGIQFQSRCCGTCRCALIDFPLFRHQSNLPIKRNKLYLCVCHSFCFYI